MATIEERARELALLIDGVNYEDIPAIVAFARAERDAALEEAAAVCDERAEAWRANQDEDGWGFAAGENAGRAAAIRALKGR